MTDFDPAKPPRGGVGKCTEYAVCDPGGGVLAVDGADAMVQPIIDKAG